MSYEEDVQRIGSYLEKYTFTNIMEDLLSRVPDTMDKREGSIIYDALAPAGYQFADYFIQLRMVLQDIFAHTATGDYLEMRAEEFGLSRIQATFATKYGYFTDTREQPMDVPIGSRFSTVVEQESVYYTVSEKTSTKGTMILTCDTAGSIGNQYSGSMLPISNINSLGSASLGTSISPARDRETDAELRERFFIYVNEKPFGGNFIDYIDKAGSVQGVGGVQCYPVWQGGGTVKVVVIDNEYNINSSLINLVKRAIDPEPHTGLGAGVAPIGHRVTVVSPTALNVSVSLDVELAGFTLDQLRDQINEQISDYFLELRKNWSVFADNHKYYLYVYRAQIISRLVENVAGVANVKNVTLNGKEEDIFVSANNSVSQLPFLGGVTINEIFG